jgi:hypothetical protein
MRKFGIDISRWQGDFDFAKAVAEGVEFAIIKGGGGDDGLYTDSKFERNYKEAKAKGLPVGSYWFSKALSIAEAEKEAEYFHTNILKGKQFELPVYMDVEHNDMINLGKEKLTSIVKAFCEKMESYGYWVGIYSTKYWFTTYMNDAELKPYAHWIAQWYTSCTYPNEFGMWQFGGETNLIRTNKVAGVTCDQNYMYVDYPTLIKNAGLNGFTKVTKPVLKSVDEIAKEVVNGKWGNGADRKNRLTQAGYNYAEVQARVNAMMKPAKKSVADIAKEVIQGKWGVGADRKKRLTEAGYNYAEVQAEVNKYFK